MASVYIDTKHQGDVVRKEIYGQFSEHLGRCIYGGLYVGEDSPIPNERGIRKDVLDALRKIHVPALRWPGGCFADEYHWKDAIGEKSGRKRMVNTNWGYVVEDNSFGTDEFLTLCDLLNCEPYICGNVGSGSVQEMAEWVEYVNSDGDSSVVKQRWTNGRKDPWNVKFWGVGNESWGCGGNMTPEYYANEYKRYQTFCRNYGENKLYKIACGPNGDDWKWTEIIMREAGQDIDGLSMHYYTVPQAWQHKGSATKFDEDEYYETIRRAADIDRIITDHSAVMDRYDREKRVGLVIDEWGIWTDTEPGTNPAFLYQQNSMRDAVLASTSLNIFNHHCDRVSMANIAQMINVLQSMILTDGDRMITTPTYHVFDLFQEHMDGKLLDSAVFTDDVEGLKKVNVSASQKENHVTVTLTNVSCTSEEKTVITLEGSKIDNITAKQLSGDKCDCNTFENPFNVSIKQIEKVEHNDGKITVTLPPCSVTMLDIEVN